MVFERMMLGGLECSGVGGGEERGGRGLGWCWEGYLGGFLGGWFRWGFLGVAVLACWASHYFLSF